MLPSQQLITLLLENNIKLPTLNVLRKLGEETAYYFTQKGVDALTVWVQLRQLVEGTGYWPALLGTAIDFEALRNDFARHPQAQPPIYGEGFVMHESASVASLERQHSETGLTWLERERQVRQDDEMFLPRSEWPTDRTPLNSFSSLYDYRTKEPYDEVFVALVPTKVGWLVPAYLSFGDWNDCPPPEIHVSLLHYWHERYGAELVSLTHDTLELRVSAPPTTPEAAIKLAEEQFLYCSDIEAGGSVDDLAAELLGASVWSFWWD